MSYYCPTCQGLFYNRRLAHCGFCGAAIPEGLRFTSEEITALDKKRFELEEQRAQRERVAAEEEAVRKKAEETGYGFPGIM
jgi:predicted nucleic acid-binding Zn ribbon protein